jgi:hypothetical protein|tara:strand:- start:3246 stop:3356 length:111 start_codon:yes stop_codon:yes gene_type:complete
VRREILGVLIRQQRNPDALGGVEVVHQSNFLEVRRG